MDDGFILMDALDGFSRTRQSGWERSFHVFLHSPDLFGLPRLGGTKVTPGGHKWHLLYWITL